MTLVNGTEKESGAQNGLTPHPEQTGDVEVVEDIHVADDALIYGVTDNPPIHLTVLFMYIFYNFHVTSLFWVWSKPILCSGFFFCSIN
jgi:hypothetical protein